MLTSFPSFVLGISQPNSTVLESDISYHPTSAMAPACSPCFYPQHSDFPPTLPCHPPRVISQNANMVLSLPSLNPEGAPTALRLDSETFTKGSGAHPSGHGRPLPLGPLLQGALHPPPPQAPRCHATALPICSSWAWCLLKWPLLQGHAPCLSQTSGYLGHALKHPVPLSYSFATVLRLFAHMGCGPAVREGTLPTVLTAESRLRHCRPHSIS